VELVEFLAGTEHDVKIRDMHDPAVAVAASGYGIRRLPAIVIDGRLADCYAALYRRSDPDPGDLRLNPAVRSRFPGTGKSPLGKKQPRLGCLNQSRGKLFSCGGRALAPRHPSELLSLLPHDRGCPFEPDADAAPLVDIAALGGNAPDDILRVQYRLQRSPP